MASEPHASSSAAFQLDDEQLEDFNAVFTLLDPRRVGRISRSLLATALSGSGLCTEEEGKSRAAAAEAEDGEEELSLVVFRDQICELVAEQVQRSNERSNRAGGASAPTTGTALLGTLDWLRRDANDQQDFRLAHHAKEMATSLKAREEARRLHNISERHGSESQGVQEAHMMQAMEFNGAWSTNMGEFEKQAKEIEEQVKARQAEEFEAFQQQLTSQTRRSYKFSRELLQLRKAMETLAKQGDYDKAHEIKLKAEQLERWERMKLDNDLKMHVATKELQLRQQQQLQLEALRTRIQRGREEHKEHWLLGAQRLMQSHRNMLSDLKTKQSLENVRADVAVKLDLASSRAVTAKEAGRSGGGGGKNPYANARPRVDSRRPESRRQ